MWNPNQQGYPNTNVNMHFPHQHPQQQQPYFQGTNNNSFPNNSFQSFPQNQYIQNNNMMPQQNFQYPQQQPTGYYGQQNVGYAVPAPKVEVKAKANPLDNMFGKKKEEVKLVQKSDEEVAKEYGGMFESFNKPTSSGPASNPGLVPNAPLSNNGLPRAPLSTGGQRTQQNNDFGAFQSASNNDFGMFSNTMQAPLSNNSLPRAPLSNGGPRMQESSDFGAFQSAPLSNNGNNAGFGDFQSAAPPAIIKGIDLKSEGFGSFQSANDFGEFQSAPLSNNSNIQPPLSSESNETEFGSFQNAPMSNSGLPKAPLSNSSFTESAKVEDSVSAQTSTVPEAPLSNTEPKQCETLPPPKNAIDDWIHKSFEGAFNSKAIAAKPQIVKEEKPKPVQKQAQTNPKASNVNWDHYRTMLQTKKEEEKLEENQENQVEVVEAEKNDELKREEVEDVNTAFGSFYSAQDTPYLSSQYYSNPTSSNTATKVDSPKSESSVQFGSFVSNNVDNVEFGAFESASTELDDFAFDVKEEGNRNGDFASFQSNDKESTFASVQNSLPPPSNEKKKIDFSAFPPSNESKKTSFGKPQLSPPPSNEKKIDFSAFQSSSPPSSKKIDFASFGASSHPPSSNEKKIDFSAFQSSPPPSTDNAEFASFGASSYPSYDNKNNVFASFETTPVSNEVEFAEFQSVSEEKSEEVQFTSFDTGFGAFETPVSSVNDTISFPSNDSNQNVIDLKKFDISNSLNNPTVSAEELFEKSASAFSLEFSKVMESKRVEEEEAKELEERKEVIMVEKKEEVEKPVIHVIEKSANVYDLFKAKQNDSQSLEIVLKRLISNLRFDDASLLKSHIHHKRELDSLKTQYKEAKDQDDLELALSIRKTLLESEKKVLNEETVTRICNESNTPIPFPLNDMTSELMSKNPKKGIEFAKTYSLSAVLEVAEGEDPSKALELISKAEKVFQDLTAVRPSSSLLNVWQRLIDETNKEIDLFTRAFERASQQVQTMKEFGKHAKVKSHFEALHKMYMVAQRCSVSLLKYEQKNNETELRSKWKNLCSLSRCSLFGEGVEMNETGDAKCHVCWNNISERDSGITHLTSERLPCHVTCTNLYLNRIDENGNIPTA